MTLKLLINDVTRMTADEVIGAWLLIHLCKLNPSTPASLYPESVFFNLLSNQALAAELTAKA